MSSYFSQSRLLWKPTDPSFTRVDFFRRRINHKHGLNLKDFHDLHKYSVEDYQFWKDLWDFLEIIHSVPPEKILDKGPWPEVPTWFPGARLNYAENLLRRNDDWIALTATNELGRISHYSWRQLRQMVKEMGAALRVNGLGVGDRVAVIATNSPTAVVIALATASCGGIFSSTAPDMGPHGILDRFKQIQPKFIFSETEVVYAGKTINLLEKVTEVVKQLKETTPNLAHVVLWPSTTTGKQIAGAEKVPFSQSVEAFLATGDGRELKFEQLPFNHPLYILYSSGTSGPPKCIVHTAGGSLLQNKKDLTMNFGVVPDDTYFFYTTTAWMMWPQHLAALACGARMITYDGSPFHPSPEAYLKFISDQHITAWGTSPRFLSEIQGRGIKPLEIASFPSLRTIGSTGAVLTAPVHEWAHHAFGGDKPIFSPSGGTDIFGTFVGGCPALPVYAGEIPVKMLGMKVEVFDPHGRALDETGEPGELVCTRPHPSLPLGFWGDPTGEKFRDAYYGFYPGVWRQGDFMAVNPKTKGMIIFGRSDGVLNPSGVRFGSAEIYTVLEKFSAEVDDSVVVGQRRPSETNERVLLFLKMRPGHSFTPILVQRVKKAIREALSPRHVPSYIFETTAIPYTINGKKIEIAVKQTVSGSKIKPSGTVANPESLDLYRKYVDLEKIVGEQAKAKL